MLMSYNYPSLSSLTRRPISYQKIPTQYLPPLQSYSSSSAQLQHMEELPPSSKTSSSLLFQSMEEPKALFYANNLKPLDTQFKIRENKVKGCVSHVWVRVYLDEDKNVSPDFSMLLGLQQTLKLTPSRNNGFLNMLKLMQRNALESLVEEEKGNGSSGNGQIMDDNSEKHVANSSLDSNADAKSGVVSSSQKGSEESSSGLGSRGMRTKEKLEKELSPIV